MPFRKTYKKKIYRKKRVYKKKMTKKVNFGMQIYHGKRYTQSPTYGSSVSAGCSYSVTDGLGTFTTAASIGSHYLSISLYHIGENIPQFGEYQSMFDQYKFRGVAVKILPVINSVSTGDATSAMDTGCFIHHNVDYDDGVYYAASVAGVVDMQQDAGYKMVQGFRTVSKYYKPKLKQDVYAIAGAAEVGVSALWLDTINFQVPHYGSKYIFEVINSTVTSQVYKFKILCTYYLDLKGTR